MKQSQSIVHKKAQMTLFILLGLVLLVSIVVFFTWDTINVYVQEISQELGRSAEEQEHYETLQACMTDATEQGLRKIESQGAYLTLPRDAVHIHNSSFGMFANNGVQHIFLNDIEHELSLFISAALQESCFSESERYSIERSETIETTVQFFPEKLHVTVDWSLRFRSIQDPTEIFSIEDAIVGINTHFLTLFEEAERHTTREIDYGEQYFNALGVNVTAFSEDNATLFLLEKDEEYLIILVHE